MYNEYDELDGNIIEVSGRPRIITMYDDFIGNEELTAYERWVYVVLKKYANSDNKCVPSHETIAKVSGLSISTVKRALKGLQDYGYIIIKNRHMGNKQKLSNFYILLNYSVEEIKEMKRLRDLKIMEAQKEQEKRSEAVNHERSEQNNTVSLTIKDLKKDSINNNMETSGSQVIENNISEIMEITENKITEASAKTLLKVSNGDFEAIKKYYEYSKTQDIEKLGAWLVSAIQSNFNTEDTSVQATKKADKPKKNNNNYRPTATPSKNNTFNNFQQRAYTKDQFDDIEQMLMQRNRRLLEEYNAQELLTINNN